MIKLIGNHEFDSEEGRCRVCQLTREQIDDKIDQGDEQCQPSPTTRESSTS
jgi:hypothetical protein